MKNEFFNKLQKAYEECAQPEQIKELLGRGRAKKGMFEGDLIEGELEIGQISGLFEDIKSAKDIIDEMIRDFEIAKNEIKNW